MDNQIKRGEIYYVYADEYTGSECGGGRPAVVVSNDTGNLYAPIIEVVYLTTQDKKPMPTHVEIQSAPRPSIALCEQIHTVDKARVSGYAGQLTADELCGIDNALRVSLGLGQADGASVPTTQQSNSPLAAVRAERDIYRRLYEGVIDRLIGERRHADN